jgi:hypothetical protein
MFYAGRGLEIKLRYDHSSRSVSGAGFASGLGIQPGGIGGYSENRAFLTIGYRPRTAQST